MNTIDGDLVADRDVVIVGDGTCEPACPVEATTQDRRVPEDRVAFVADSARFFHQPLPGRGGRRRRVAAVLRRIG